MISRRAASKIQHYVLYYFQHLLTINGGGQHRMWYMAFAADPFKYVEAE